MVPLNKFFWSRGCLGLILLLTCTKTCVCIQSTNFNVRPTNILSKLDDSSSTETKKVEFLLLQALVAETPTSLQKASSELIKEIVKILGTLGVFILSEDSSCLLPESLIEGLIVFSPAVSDLLIHKNDPSLEALKKLQQYIHSSLQPEQKFQISEIFNKKYEKKLSKKILKEEQNKGIKWLKRLITVLDLAILPILWMFFINYIDSSNFRSLAVKPILLDFLVLFYNLYDQNQNSKSRLLQKIKNDLTRENSSL